MTTDDRQSEIPAWRQEGNPYYPLGFYFRRHFGETVRKVSVDAGFSCPNRDGTVGWGGCVFCDNRSFSPARRLGLADIADQIAEGISRLSQRYPTRKFIAYFQPSTNTYAPIERLESLYRKALAQPGIVGLAIGTRPDTLPDDVLDLLADLSRETWLTLEIGLQSTKDSTLRFLNRGHDYATFKDAVERARARGIRLGTHLILGLPDESEEDNIRTARQIAGMGFHSVKLHNLYVVKETRLAELYARGEISLPSLADYAKRVVDFLERLSPETVVDRLAGDAPKEFLVDREWSGEKNSARTAILDEFRRRKTWQGRLFPDP